MFTKESDMYPVLKEYFETSGYTIKSEVMKCDIIATKGDEHLIIEMKLRFNLDVIYQVISRMTLSPHVMIAVPCPVQGRKAWDKNYQSMLKLCKRIGVGLAIVYDNHVSIAVEPDDIWIPRKSPKRIKRMNSEISRRSGDHNIGGTTKCKQITAYKEDSLKCAECIHVNDLHKPSEIKKKTGVEKAPSILSRNVYGWFDKTSTGYYIITKKGINALKEYDFVLQAQKA